MELLLLALAVGVVFVFIIELLPDDDGPGIGGGQP